jgi:hypothetical protein
LMPDSGPENSVIWFTSLGASGSRPLRIHLDFTKCAALLFLAVRFAVKFAVG